MKNIGFFGGSFDPIHLGHLNLAIQILEKLKLDKIIFCPANVSPFKTENPPIASSKDRFEMVKIAIQDFKNFDLTNFEIRNENISYTINTLKEIKNSDNLRLIITEDTLLNFHKWKDYKNILQIALLIVGVRNKFLENFKSENFTLNNKNFVKTNIFEISSTEIRKRLKNHKNCLHLIPKETLDYIYNRKLYL
ncbi:MAG: Nicotinate-nucleotide adenylyltransferase [Candidatus Anoxychlamydiales bacterium]|nr:Nicotinate-nucleotide adenylyltransferase [Candidatus Anoxychlamydiales bacterium]HEU65007.1 nicotinate (nicotinamide) nucleotide adenylyltransferase [Chlamydiota bacterium]